MTSISPSLPPEFSPNSRTYGYLKIEIGNLNWLNTSNSLDEIYIQPKFWGEKNQIVLLRARNAGKNLESECLVIYQIKNKISAFKKYLEDMGRIKLWVKNVEEKVLGVCVVNLLIHLKTAVRERDDSPIEFINEAFPIITNAAKGETTQTIGELEIKIECKFERNKLNETINLSEISEVRGKYSGARKKSPNEKADSSFLLNEMKSQIPNKENANQVLNIPEEILPKPIQTEIKFQYSDKGNDPVQTLNYYPSQQTFFPKFGLSPEKLTKEGLLLKPDAGTTTEILENEENQKLKNANDLNDKKVNSKLDDLLEKGKKLKNKLQKFSGENLTAGIFDEISNEDATKDFYGPLERIGKNDGKKLIPEIESLKLQLDEAVYMDEINKKQESDKALKQFDSLQLRAISFLADSKELKDKFRDCVLEVWIPVFQNDQAFKKIRLGIQDEEDNNLFYNQEIDTKINLIDSNHSYILQESIKFKFIAFPEKINEKEVASSEFKLENIIDKPKFQSVFHATLELKTSTTLEKPAISNNNNNNNKNNKKKTKEKENKETVENERKRIDIQNIFGSFKKAGVLKFFLALKKTEMKPEKESVKPNIEESFQNFRNYQFLLHIDSIKNLMISETANTFVRYKILSSNETIETPVIWNQNNPVFDHKMIFPLLPEFFEKIIKTPFILEIWNKSNRDQLLGLVHLNLSPISSVIHDSSLKLNKFPMIIYDDELNIRHLLKKEDQGIIKIILALGNVLQINKYESFLKTERQFQKNPPHEIEIKKEKKEATPCKIPEGKPFSKKKEEEIPSNTKSKKTSDLKEDSFSQKYFNNRTLIEIFVSIFFDIQNNSKKISAKLKSILDLIAKNGGVVEKPFFISFLDTFEISADEIERVINALMATDFEKVNGSYFIESYRAFCSLNVVLNERFEEIKRILKNKMTVLKRKLEDKADFGYISKINMEGIIEKHSDLTKQQTEIFVGIFNNPDESIIDLSEIYEYIINPSYPKRASPNLYNILISEKLRSQFKISDNIIFQLIENETLEEIYSQNKIKLFFQKNNYQLSLWETLCLMEDVRNKRPETGWEALREYLKEFQTFEERSNHIDQRINLKHSSSDEIENLAYLLNEKNHEELNLKPASPRKETILEEKGINTSNEKKEEEVKNEFLIPEYEEKTHKSYVFKIKCQGLMDLELNEKDETYMILRYVFPNEENAIESNMLSYSKREKDYQFMMKSEHSLTLKLNESLNKMISDRQMLKVSLFIKKNSDSNEIKIGEALIPMLDLFAGEKNYNAKTDFKSKITNKYALHSTDHIILGHLCLNLTFKCKSFFLSSSAPIKQTTIQKLLPKQGYLIIELKKISSFQTGFDKLDISELSEKNVECLKNRDFRSTLFFNLFSEDEDLGEIFKSFETSSVYGKIGYEINFLKVFELKLNEAIIEYLKEKKGIVELRIYFGKNEYFTLGACEFSLLDLLLKGQINSDFELFNFENQAIAALSLNIEISNAAPSNPSKQELKINKPCVLMQLHINEIIFDDNRLQNLTFNFRFGDKNYKSKKYELKNNNYLQISDCYFMMDSSESQKIEILEIKLYEGEIFFGYVNIDLPKLISNGSDYFGQNLYLAVASSDCLNNTALKIRIGLKIIGFFFENENMLERSRKIIKEFTPDKLESLDQKEEKSLEEIKEIFNLSKMETTKFLSLFPKCDIPFILKFLCPKIRSDLDYNDLEEDKELSNEFGFYDYDNNGFVDFDNAIKIFYIFETIFHTLTIDDFAKYAVRSSSLDKNIQILNLDEKFDYLLFIHKTKKINPLARKKQNYELIDRNTMNVQNLIANKFRNIIEENLPPPRIEAIEQPVRQKPYFFPKPLVITVFSANNLSSINEGAPPNSYISFPKFKLATDIAYRENSPIWSQSFNLSIKENDRLLQIEIFSRAYNLENTFKINTDKKLEEINIDLETVYKALEEEYEYNVVYSCGSRGDCLLKVGFKLMEKNNFLEEEMKNFDPNLIKSFHQALAELKKDEREPILNFNEEPEIEETHEPIKLEKTINDLDQLKHSLLQILNKSPDLHNLLLPPKSNNPDINNPFENYLFENEKTLKIKDEENSNLMSSEIDPPVQKNTEEYFEKENSDKKLDFSQKPPLAKNNSLKNLKEMEKSLKDNKEMERIAKIMKNKEPLKSQKFYDVSSDSDY